MVTVLCYCSHCTSSVIPAHARHRLPHHRPARPRRRLYHPRKSVCQKDRACPPPSNTTCTTAPTPATTWPAPPTAPPAGAARWRETENGVKLERFAVLADFRNQEIGAALLHAVLADVQAELPDAEVYLNAQLRAVPFYERHGFHKKGEHV